MKKIAAIALCGILLFNWVGYRLLISFFQDKAAARLESQLDDNNYDESQLISIKIPAVHLSSYTNSGQFERTNGQVEIKGVLYKYVKKRLCNDSLEFICVQDCANMKLQSAKNDFFSVVNDLKHCGSEKKTGSHPIPSKNFSTDYYTVTGLFTITGINLTTSIKACCFFTALSDIALCGIEQPPETIA